MEVFNDLVDFCKTEAKTGLDKWDFGVGIKLLLERNKKCEKIAQIEKRLTKLEEGD